MLEERVEILEKAHERDVKLISLLYEQNIIQGNIIGDLLKQQNINHEVREVKFSNFKYGMNYLPQIMALSALMTATVVPILNICRYLMIKYRIISLPFKIEEITSFEVWFIMGFSAILASLLCIKPLKHHIKRMFSPLHPKWELHNPMINFTEGAFLQMICWAVFICLTFSLTPIGDEVPAEYKDIYRIYMSDWGYITLFVVNSILLTVTLIISNSKANKEYIMKYASTNTNINKLNNIKKQIESVMERLKNIVDSRIY